MLLGLMVFETSCGKEKKQDICSTVEFTHFSGKEQALEGTPSPSENNLLYLETKSPQIINKQDDTEYTIALSSFDHGTATYSVEADLSAMNEGNLEVTYPVFYVEKLLEEKQILYPPANENNPLVEISDSSIEYPETGQGVLVKVVSSDLEQLPYQIVLKSNGETYEGAVSYYFDTISGNFEKGYYIMSGIAMPMFDFISDDEHNRFTKRDVLDAMNMYQESYVTYSRAEVERVSGISVPPNKRNGRKQAVHLERARAVQNIDYPDGE